MTDDRPTALLVHGAGSGPWVFADWPADLAGWRVATVDLQHGLDAASAGMYDYAAALVAAAAPLPEPQVLVGWSMGGLVALMATAEIRPAVLVLIEPSPPSEVQGTRPEIAPRDGTFDPQDVYGPLPERLQARPESVRARMERKRGISVPPPLPCPSIVVFGREFPDVRGRHIARVYGSIEMEFPDLSHSALVGRPEVRMRLGGVVAGLLS